MLARLGRLRAGLGAAAAVGASAAALSARQQQQLCACASAPAPPSPAEPAAPDAPPPPSEPGIVDKVLAPAREAYEAASDAVYDTFIKPYAEPSRDKLLPDLPPALAAKPTLVVALDGLLIESVYTRQHGWRYVKRPGLDAFLDQLFPFYEIVLWTECLVNADPVVDKFDPRRRIRHRLYRDTTTYRNGHHYKDLEVLNRDLRKVLILDTDDESYAMQPSHGITVPEYKHANDPEKKDDALTKLVPFLQYCALAGLPDLSAELAQYAGKDLATAFEGKLAELRASGKLRLPRRVGGVEAGQRGNTIWDRMRQRREQ